MNEWVNEWMNESIIIPQHSRYTCYILKSFLLKLNLASALTNQYQWLSWILSSIWTNAPGVHSPWKSEQVLLLVRDTCKESPPHSSLLSLDWVYNPFQGHGSHRGSTTSLPADTSRTSTLPSSDLSSQPHAQPSHWGPSFLEMSSGPYALPSRETWNTVLFTSYRGSITLKCQIVLLPFSIPVHSLPYLTKRFCDPESHPKPSPQRSLFSFTEDWWVLQKHSG